MTSILCLDLGRTTSYQTRRAYYVPTTGEHDGRLTILVSKYKGAGANCDVDTYAVQRDGDAFLLLNETDAGQRDVYQVVPACGRRPASCTCPAGFFRKSTTCKHIAALTAIIAHENDTAAA